MTGICEPLTLNCGKVIFMILVGFALVVHGFTFVHINKVVTKETKK